MRKAPVSASANSIDVSDLRGGTYVVAIESAEGVLSRRQLHCNFGQLYEGHEVHRADFQGFGRSHQRTAAELVQLDSAEQQGSFGSRNIRRQKHLLLDYHKSSTQYSFGAFDDDHIGTST